MAKSEVYCQCRECKETFEVTVDLRGERAILLPQPRVSIRAGQLIHHCGGNGHIGQVKAFADIGKLVPGDYRLCTREPKPRGRPRQAKHIFEASS